MQNHGGDLERVDSTPLHGPAMLRRESSVNTEKVDAEKVLLEASAKHKTIEKSQLEFGRKIDEGDVGRVFKAKYRGQQVACKQVKTVRKHSSPGQAMDDPAYVDIMRELSSMQSLRIHPNIVTFIGVCVEDPTKPILVEEYIRGKTLRRIMDNGVVGGVIGKIPDKTKFGWILQLFQGLEFLHSSTPMVIHRDIKPANIIVTRDLNTIKIADFGTARRFDNPHQDVCERTGNIMYMAPEVAETSSHGGHYGAKCDVFSAGLLSWRIASGQPLTMSPVRSGKYPSIHEVKMEGLKEIILQTWKNDPAQRPSSHSVVAKILAVPDRPTDLVITANGLVMCAPDNAEALYKSLTPGCSIS